jgi:hypothetical protein
MALNGYMDVISDLLSTGKTYMEISAHLQNLGVSRGASEANIRKFCREADINPRSRSLTEAALNCAVENAVLEVGFDVFLVSLTSL